MAFSVREASIQYQSKRTALTTSVAFKGEVVRDVVNSSGSGPNPYDIIGMIADGLSFAEFEDLQACLDVSKARLAELLGISKATLQRREAVGELQADESDRLVRFARLLGQAIGVFESLEYARRWLKAPKLGLNQAVPLDFAKSEAGALEVGNLLGRIEYGVYS